MLSKIRLCISTVVMIAITLLLLDFTGNLYHGLGWLPKLQFLPALLSLNIAVLIFLVLLTLIFGRIYCSVICPLGIFQDIIAWIPNRKRKNRYSYSKPKTYLRYSILILLIIAFVLGINSLVALFAPYSSYGRIVTNLFQPVYLLINNGLAAISEKLDDYTFFSADIWMRSLPTFVMAIITLVALFILAWRNGRTYCNTLCPVGTILGLLSRFSILKMVINTDVCKNCRKCERNCKAACIDINTHSIDYSRCVVCGNCMADCHLKAISYGHKPTIDKEMAIGNKYKAEKENDSARRAFLVGSAIALATATKAQDKKKVDGGLAIIEDKKPYDRQTPITPAGSISLKNMYNHCTACQLCVSACPNQVLRPSTDLNHLMQPTMSYERGYCRPECNKCSEICPAGAILPIELPEKASTQIGHAVLVKENCLACRNEAKCGNCARHCPTGAITMVEDTITLMEDGEEYEQTIFVPAVDQEKCIGCGACEYVCPSRPYSAIYVEGHEVHRTI